MGRSTDAGGTLAEALEPIAEVIMSALQADPPPMADGPARIDQDVDSFDADHGDPRDEGFTHPLHLVALVLHSRLYLIADTLEGIALIGRHGAESTPPVSYSGQAIARTTLDAAAFSYWLAEPEIGHDERVKRLVQDTVHEVKSGTRLAPLALEDGVRMPSSINDIVEMCRAYDVPYGKPSNEGDFPRVGNRPSAATIMAPLMKTPDYLYLGAVLYNEISDVAHGATSGILKPVNVTASEDSIDVGFARHQVLRRLVPLAWALYEPLTVVFRYLGWDTAALERAFRDAADVLEQEVTDDE